MRSGITDLAGRPVLAAKFCRTLGVHGTKVGSLFLIANFPMFSGWKPSTSFVISTCVSTLSSSTCAGSGICTRIPSTFSESLYRRTASITSSVVDASCMLTLCDTMPTDSHALCFMRTYVSESCIRAYKLRLFSIRNGIVKRRDVGGRAHE